MIIFDQGAGEAAIGIAQLIASAVEKREGIPYSEAIKRVWLKDSRGLIVKGQLTYDVCKNFGGTPLPPYKWVLGCNSMDL